MFELAVVLTRYLMIIYIVAFFFVTPRMQKLIVLLLHSTAFTILAYNNKDKETLLIAIAGFIFILVASKALDWAYKDSNKNLWNIMFFLMDIGLIMITRLNIPLAQRQLLWFGVGIAAVLCIPMALKIFKYFDKFRYIYLILSAVLICSPFLIGRQIYGSVNWVSIGDFSFQPSEIVKFLFVFYLASTFRRDLNFKKIIISAVISAGFVLTLVYQRDLGGALIFFMTYMLMMYGATGNAVLFGIGMAAFSVASVAAFHMFPHVQVRVEAWLNTWSTIDTSGYQIALGLFSIGTYGFLGSGLTLGYPNYNSVVERDMIFAAICEEFGSLFGVLLILLYLRMFYRGMEISLKASSKFYSLIALGFSVILAFQTFLILGGILRVIPLTGVTLPFISYGGSSVVVVLLMVGILQWIHSQNMKEHEEFLNQEL